jgi:hypothetical protein
LLYWYIFPISSNSTSTSTASSNQYVIRSTPYDSNGTTGSTQVELRVMI